MGIRIRIRKKQNKIENKHDDLIKRLDEHINWMNEKQIKSEEENNVEFEPTIRIRKKEIFEFTEPVTDMVVVEEKTTVDEGKEGEELTKWIQVEKKKNIDKSWKIKGNIMKKFKPEDLKDFYKDKEVNIW